MFNVILGKFSAFPIVSDFQQTYISKTAGHRLKRTKVWARGLLVYTGYFRLLSVQDHSEAVRCLPNFNNLVSQTRLVIERKGPNFESRGPSS